jgi:protein pelota
VLIPEESEDMWHAYNSTECFYYFCRKVKDESSTGSSTSNRVRTNLTISIETIEFDTAACQLRVKGKNIQENQYVKMGAYHTIDLQLNQKFTLAKQNWDVIALDRLGQYTLSIPSLSDLACDPTRTADVAAVIMQEG